jgi:hypothetical protein
MPASAYRCALYASRKKPRASPNTAGSTSLTSGIASGVTFTA